MTENYKIGQTVFFNYKGKQVEAKIIRINQKTLSVTSENLKGRVGYGSVYSSVAEIQNKNVQTVFPCPQLERSEYSTQTDLETMLKEVKHEFYDVFNSIFNENEKRLLSSVKIYWGNRYTYSRLGTYRYGEINPNTIRISKSLKNTPIFVIKKVIFHELLHIKFHNHGKEFRYYERKYPNIEEAKKYLRLLCKEIKKNGMNRILNIPITRKKIEQKTPKLKTENEIIVETTKRLNVFPSSMNEENLDELDIRFLTMRIKSIKRNIYNS